jgi:hypothetical protein
MRLNHVGYSANLKLFLGVLLAACFLATAAHADSLFTGTFKLTNDVHWGNAVLAPGAYSLTVDQPARSIPIIIIRDTRTGKIVARAMVSGPNYVMDRGDSKLLLAVQGNQRVVRSVRLAGLGEVFQLAHPFAASGKATEETHNSEAVPVDVAKK